MRILLPGSSLKKPPTWKPILSWLLAASIKWPRCTGASPWFLPSAFKHSPNPFLDMKQDGKRLAISTQNTNDSAFLKLNTLSVSVLLYKTKNTQRQTKTISLKQPLPQSYCWWKKSETTTWDVSQNAVNNGINYQPQLVSESRISGCHQQYAPDTPGHLALVSIQTHACVPCMKVCLIDSVPCAQVLVLLLSVHHPVPFGERWWSKMVEENDAKSPGFPWIPKRTKIQMSFESQSDFAIIFLYPIPENVGEKNKTLHPLRNRKVESSSTQVPRWMSCMYFSNSVMVGSSVDLRCHVK